MSTFLIDRWRTAPNTVNAIMAVSSFNLADAILTVAALSFLGFGVIGEGISDLVNPKRKRKRV